MRYLDYCLPIHKLHASVRLSAFNQFHGARFLSPLAARCCKSVIKVFFIAERDRERGKGERGEETGREREREKERQTDAQTDRQAQTDRRTQTDR